MDTLPKSGPDHVGIVSDKVDENGRPLIINNWDDGYKTQDMALLGSIPITHRFALQNQSKAPTFKGRHIEHEPWPEVAASINRLILNSLVFHS